MRSIWLNALRVGVSIGLIALLAWWTRGRFAQVASLLAAVQPGWLAAGFIVYLAVTAALSARLQQVLSAAAVRVPWLTVTRFTFIGMLFNNFLPTATGGDVVKAYYIGKSTDVAWKAWLGVVGDRMIGSATFLLLTMAALLISPQDATLGKVGWGYVAVGVAMCIGSLGVLWWARRRLASGGAPPWCRRLQPLLTMLDQSPRLLRYLTVAALLSVGAQILFVVAIFLLARSLLLPVGLMELFLVMPLVAAASMVPSINGLGVRESALVLCLGRSVGRDPALALALLLLAVLIGTSLIGGVLYAAQGGRYDRQRAVGYPGLSGVQDARST